MYQQDYIMRLIKEMINFLAKIYLHIEDKDEVYYDLLYENKNSQTDYLHKELLKLIQLGKINEAENLLFEKLDKSNKKTYRISFRFLQ